MGNISLQEVIHENVNIIQDIDELTLINVNQEIVDTISANPSEVSIVNPIVNPNVVPFVSDSKKLQNFSQEANLSTTPSDLSTLIVSDQSDIESGPESNHTGDMNGNNPSMGKNINIYTMIDISGIERRNVHTIADDATRKLNNIRMKHVNNVIIGHLNINSLANKCDALCYIIRDNLDILVIGETKLDDTFTEKQFIINGFCKPYRLDRNHDGGGVMVYVREDIPSRELATYQKILKRFLWKLI